MSLELPFGVKNVGSTPTPIEAIKYNNSGLPYTNTAEVISQVSSSVRYKGQEFFVDNGSGGIDIYWFKDNITTLVKKQATSGLYAEITSFVGGVFTVDVEGYDTLQDGIPINIKFINRNATANPSINISSLGTKPLKKQDAGGETIQIYEGEIDTNTYYTVIYNTDDDAFIIYGLEASNILKTVDSLNALPGNTLLQASGNESIFTVTLDKDINLILASSINYSFKRGKTYTLEVGTDGLNDFPWQLTFGTGFILNDGVSPVFKNNNPAKKDIVELYCLDDGFVGGTRTNTPTLQVKDVYYAS